MTIGKDDFIRFYATQVQSDDMSLFLGAGISASSGYPTWSKLLEPCAKLLNIEITDSTNLFKLSQYYANQYGISELKKVINNNINILNKQNDLIAELTNFNFKTIWTTNFDTLVEKTLADKNILTNVISDEKNLPNTKCLNRINIYKLNGDINHLNEIVITQEDIDSYNKNHELFLTFLKKELVTNTFLFLGYSFKDNIILSCLSSIKQYLGEGATCHYTILKRESDDPEFQHFIYDIEKRYPIKILLVDTYDEIPEILNELKNKIQSKNIFFSGVFDSLPDDDEKFAKDICKKITYELFEREYKIFTGYGRTFGYYLSGNATQYLLTNNKEVERNLIIRPFQESMTSEEKTNYRKMLLSDCSVVIFMYGQKPDAKKNRTKYIVSDGMLEEFEIAKESGKYIIPVGSTGFVAKSIWNEVKSNLSKYAYLEKYIENLNSSDASLVVKTILQILNEISNHV